MAPPRPAAFWRRFALTAPGRALKTAVRAGSAKPVSARAVGRRPFSIISYSRQQTPMISPKVTIITGTWNREAFLPAIHACVRAQTYQNFEWIVLDDSDQPSEELRSRTWKKLKYIYSDERITLGEKRNRMVAQAEGEIIVNFDDDDYYGPDYVEKRVESIRESGCQLSIMSGFFVHQLNTGHLGFYRTLVKEGPAYQFGQNGVQFVNLANVNIPFIHLCFGWSFVYYKSLWEKVKFQDITMFEDREFTRKCLEHTKIDFYESKSIDAIHAIHNLSSSNCFPQFIIPPFMLASGSRGVQAHIQRLAGVVQQINQTGQPRQGEQAAQAIPG